MSDIENPKYVVGYFGKDYKNISMQFGNRKDIEILNLIEEYDKRKLENKISSFICEVDNFSSEEKSYSNILYDVISTNKIDGTPIISIQTENTSFENMSEFKKFISSVDNNINNTLKTPVIKCSIGTINNQSKDNNYSIVTDAIESNQILKGNEYKNAIEEIKSSVKNLKQEYMEVFSKKVKDTIKQNKDNSKEDIKNEISMTIISTISLMTKKIGKELENQIGKKDKYTKGHINSTAEISNMLAEELSSNEEIMAQYIKEKNPREKPYTDLNERSKLKYKEMLLNDVSASGLLHDAGKLPIAMQKYPYIGKSGNIEGYYSLLDMPRKLTNEEFAIIQIHPDIGYNILMEIAKSVEENIGKSLKIDIRNSLKMIGEGILYHHERVDGNGYHSIPNDKIPVVAKIIQTADIYDALISERPYKFAWPDEFARKEMRREAGKQCDEKYLDALDKIIENARKTEDTKKEFTEKIDRKDLIWDVKEIKDENKIEILKNIDKQNDARMGRKV